VFKFFPVLTFNVNLLNYFFQDLQTIADLLLAEKLGRQYFKYFIFFKMDHWPKPFKVRGNI
jgi:hypothetical protein